MRNFYLSILFALIIFAACFYDSGPDVVKTFPSTDKNPPGSDYVVKVAAYIDTSNPSAVSVLQNIGRYTIRDKYEAKIPYFDFVILGGAQIKRGNFSARAELSEELTNILNSHNTLLKPLRHRGIKILLGITGGNDGITFGTLPQETDQMVFARLLANIRSYYQLDGVEFYDINGESSGVNPYPELNSVIFNGENFFDIYHDGSSDYINRDGKNLDINGIWKDCAGNMVDMMSYLIEAFGAYSSFQGDVALDQLQITPILVRESKFGHRLPPSVPRYPFSTTMSCLAFLINDSAENFGWEDTGKPNDMMEFVDQRRYGPVIFDLNAISPAELSDYSEKFGNSDYGMVYYTNMDSHYPLQLRDILSVTSREIFNADVTLE